MKKRFALLMAVLYILCAGCSGSGFNGIITPETEPLPTPRVVTCFMCHGDGVCFHCDGEGFRDGRRCSRCSGTGYCAVCGGAGYREVFEINGKDYTICGTCHGDGKCGVCDGTGELTLGRYGGTCTLCHGSGNCVGCKGTGLTELRGF